MAATSLTFIDRIGPPQRQVQTHTGNPPRSVSAASSPASCLATWQEQQGQGGLPRSSLPFPCLQEGKPQGRKCHILSCMPLAVTHSWCLERSGCLVSVSPAVGQLHLWCSSYSDESERPSTLVLSGLCHPMPSGTPGSPRCHSGEWRGKGE